MLRNILIGLGVLAALLLGAFWWLMVAGSKAPSSAPGVMDIECWRQLIASDAGQGPQRIGWLEIGHGEFPSIAVQAGRFADPVQMSFNTVELAWPDSTILIDSAVDADAMEEMSKGGSENFDRAAYETMLAAMLQADQILLTHEHFDHVIGIARHPDPAGIAPNLTITETQRVALASFAAGEVLPEAFMAIQTLDLDQAVRVAPGVVVVPMSGHTPGTEVIFVQRADGAEFLFIGDIAWTMRNIDELTTRPRLLNVLFFDPPEVRKNILAQLRALHDLMTSDPDVTIIPAHDRVYLKGLVSEGGMEAGFASSP